MNIKLPDVHAFHKQNVNFIQTYIRTLILTDCYKIYAELITAEKVTFDRNTVQP